MPEYRSVLLITLLFCLGDSVLFSQDPQGTNVRDVVWIRQFPSEKTSDDQSFFQKMNNFIFGKKAQLLMNPVSSINDEYGNIWVLNQGNGSIVKITEEKKSISTMLINKSGSYPSLVSICSVPGKGVLFTDSYLNGVFLVSPDDQISSFTDFDSLQQPTGIAYNRKTNEVWITETGAHRVSIFSADGAQIKSLGGRGTGPGLFNFPTHIWIDPDGTAYIVDAMNFRIQIFSETGNYISGFGEAGNVSGSMARPKGIACDSKGNIYVADALFNNVQIFDKKGRFLYYFGEQGQSREQFWMPSGIYIDNMDNIYISDSYNNRVQVFQAVIKGESDEN